MLRAYNFHDRDLFLKKVIGGNIVHGLAVGNMAKACLARQLDEVLGRYTEDIPAGQKMYNYCRNKFHFARSIVESFISNLISISPLMDPELLEFDLSPNVHEDRNVLFALILDRYMPEITGIGFDLGRKIAPATWEFARRINETYPYKITSNIKQEEFAISLSPRHETSGFPRTFNSPTRQWVSLYNTEHFKKTILSEFNDYFYDLGKKWYNPDLYYGFQHISSLIYNYLLRKIIKNRRSLADLPSYLYIDERTVNATPIIPLSLSLMFISEPGAKDKLEFIDCIHDNSYNRLFKFVSPGTLLITLGSNIVTKISGIPSFVFDIINLSITLSESNKSIFEISHSYMYQNELHLPEIIIKNSCSLQLSLKWQVNSEWLSELGAYLYDNFPHPNILNNTEKLAGDNISNIFNC